MAPIEKRALPPEGAAPKLNEAGFAGVPLDAGDALAPPKLNVGRLPSGPNLPNLAGEASSIFLDGVNVLLSGVEACRGPEGANENRVVGFLASLDVDEGAGCDGALNLNGVEEVSSALAADAEDVSASASASASLTMSDTPEAFFAGVDVAGAAAGLAPKPPNVNGDDDGAVDAAGREGVKPPPRGAVEEADVRGTAVSENDPAAGGANVGGLGIAAGGAAAGAGVAAPVPAEEEAPAAAPAGRHPFFVAASSRYFPYCAPREGRICVRSVNGSSLTSFAMKPEMDTFSPRMAV